MAKRKKTKMYIHDNRDNVKPYCVTPNGGVEPNCNGINCNHHSRGSRKK